MERVRRRGVMFHHGAKIRGFRGVVVRGFSCQIVLMESVSAHSPLIIAHRGASDEAPENTLPAFLLAWRQQADAIELDVRLTRDGRIAAIHDPTTRRTAGMRRRVRSQTMDELRKLDAGSWKGPQWKDVRIPTLEEVLATVPYGKQIFIEIKCGAEILPELVRVLRAVPGRPEHRVIIAFDYETVKQAKILLPETQVCWIAKPERGSRGRRPTAATLVKKAVAAGLDGLDIDARFAIDAAFVARVHAANLKLFVWTVDAPAVFHRLRAAGLDGIATNRPALLRGQS